MHPLFLGELARLAIRDMQRDAERSVVHERRTFRRAVGRGLIFAGRRLTGTVEPL
jgi:hypothetical protein